MHLNELNACHGIDQQLIFRNGEGDIPVIDVCNAHATALISMQGAQVLSWRPVNAQGDKAEVIWCSKVATFATGRSVRGGIPICWPWFGAHASHTDFPAHGFARTSLWQVESTATLDNGRTRIDFSLQPTVENAHMWPPATSVQFQLTVGKKLEMELITCNNGNEAISIGQALHTYFNVGDVRKTFLHGLDDTAYLDKLDGFKCKHQHGPVSINEEIDRIYLNTATDCVIEDRVKNRNIIIIKCGSHSTVVWNPWRETAAKMGDLGEDGYLKMLCVESSNAAEDVALVEAGKNHHLWVQYEVQASD